MLLARGRRLAAVARGHARGETDQGVASRVEPGRLDVAGRRTLRRRQDVRITGGDAGQPGYTFFAASAETHREPPVAFCGRRTLAPSSLRLTMCSARS